MAAEEQFAGKEHAKIYSRYRRDTPLLLAEKIVSYLKEKYEGPLEMAVDVGCGSGQGTVILSPFFKKVHGMDVSEAQVEEAKKTRARNNITFEVAPAEVLPFPDHSVQLVTAGAVLHWLKMDVFFENVRRVLCNNGILAVYCYYAIKPVLDDPDQAAKVDQLYTDFYAFTKDSHAPQVQIATEKYVSVNFPFEEVIKVPEVREIFDGCLPDVVGYVSTFSGFQNMKKSDPRKAEDYLANFDARLKEIASACNVSHSDTVKLYRDFLLIICRKIDKS